MEMEEGLKAVVELMKLDRKADFIKKNPALTPDQKAGLLASVDAKRNEILGPPKQGRLPGTK